MNDTNIILLGILLVLNLISFVCGYLLGKGSSQANIGSQPKSFFEQNKTTQINSIAIDERKHVIDINTKGLEKKYETLGETKKTNENIESSINKLKNLKR
jgi:hypothetical protein